MSRRDRGHPTDPPPQDNGQIIEDTPFTVLFNSTREGVTGYRFDVPNGLYLLTLQFVEMVENGPGLRQFSVLAGAKPLPQNLDLYALYGRNYAVTYQYAVTLINGKLAITFPATVGQSTMSGIAVAPITADKNPPAVPTQVTGLGGYYRNIIS